MFNRESLPYRQSTLGIVTDAGGKYLLVNKLAYSSHDEWSFPGGGVDEGETPKEALLREFVEELNSDKFEIVGQSKHPYIYEWPDHVVEATYQKKNKYFRGTQLTQFFVKFLGDLDEVSAGDGIRNIKWVTQEELKSHLVFPNQFENAMTVISEFIK